MHGAGGPDRKLSDDEVTRIVRETLDEQDLHGKRILVIVPDGTRTAPIPKMFRRIHEALSGRVAELNFLVALGTHRPMSSEHLDNLFGVEPDEWERDFRGVGVFNHEWWKPETFASLGKISAEEVAEISGGMLEEEVQTSPTTLGSVAFLVNHIFLPCKGSGTRFSGCQHPRTEQLESRSSVALTLQ